MGSEQVNIELLRSFSPLDGLKQDNLAALARKVQVREMSPGEILFKEGDTEKRTVYVLSGSLELLDDGKVDEIIEGGLQQVIEPLINEYQADQLAALGE